MSLDSWNATYPAGPPALHGSLHGVGRNMRSLVLFRRKLLDLFSPLVLLLHPQANMLEEATTDVCSYVLTFVFWFYIRDRCPAQHNTAAFFAVGVGSSSPAVLWWNAATSPSSVRYRPKLRRVQPLFSGSLEPASCAPLASWFDSFFDAMLQWVHTSRGSSAGRADDS